MKLKPNQCAALKRAFCILFVTLFYMLFCAGFAGDDSSDSADSSQMAEPVSPSLKVSIRVKEDPDLGDCYMQNVYSKAATPMDMMLGELIQYEVWLENDGNVDLTNIRGEVWQGDRVSPETTEGVKIKAGWSGNYRAGTLYIDEHDAERGYMVLQVTYWAESVDSAYEGTIEAHDEITINVCARPEELIESFHESVQESYSESVQESIDAEKERLSGTSLTEPESSGTIVEETEELNNQESPSGRELRKRLIFIGVLIGSAGLFVLVFVLLNNRRGRRRQ